MALPNPNFCFPIKRLDSPRVSLVPFDSTVHAEPFVQASKDVPDLWTYTMSGPFSSAAEFSDWHQNSIAVNTACFLYSILAKPPNSPDGEGTLAGVIGFLNASRQNATIEIGYVS